MTNESKDSKQVQADAGAVAWRTGEIVWAVEEDAKRHAHWNKLTVEPLYTRPAAESDKRDAGAVDIADIMELADDYAEYEAGAVCATNEEQRAGGNAHRERLERAIRAAMSREQSGGDRG